MATFVIVYIILHCPKTLNSKLLVVYLCVAHLFTMIMKAEYIDINSKKIKRD